MFDYFRNCSSNTHHVCREDSPTKGLYDHGQSDDLDFTQGHNFFSNLTNMFNVYYNSHISDNI